MSINLDKDSKQKNTGVVNNYEGDVHYHNHVHTHEHKHDHKHEHEHDHYHTNVYQSSSTVVDGGGLLECVIIAYVFAIASLLFVLFI